MKNIKLFIKKNIISIITLIIGILIGFSTMVFFIPDSVPKNIKGEEILFETKNNTYSVEDYYTYLKESNNIDLLLEKVDTNLLNDLYKTTRELKNKTKEEMQKQYNYYKNTSKLNKKEFLEQQGFKTEDDFYDLILLNLKRELYYKDYIEKELISESDINKLYEEIYPDMEINFIVTQDEKTIKQVVEDIKNKKNYSDIIKEYGNKISYKQMGYTSFDTENLIKEIYEEAKKLEDYQTSTKYIKIDSNYIVVFKGKSKTKPSLEELKPRIINYLRNNIINKDTNQKIFYQSLIKLREDNNFKFYDTKLENEYKSYIGKYK